MEVKQKQKYHLLKGEKEKLVRLAQYSMLKWKVMVSEVCPNILLAQPSFCCTSEFKLDLNLRPIFEKSINKALRRVETPKLDG